MNESQNELPGGLLEYDKTIYEPVEGISQIAGYRPKFVSEFQSIDRFLIRFYKHKISNAFLGKVWFGFQCEGPPGTAHGGAVAAVMDESMGQASWIAGHPCLAAHIELNFKSRVPLNQVLTINAFISRIEGRKIYVEAQLLSLDKVLMADSNGLFIHIPAEELIP